MPNKRIKLETQPPFPITRLFDEILEEVFIHLKPKDQLSCRQVCHLWNDLLCRDTRLLKKNVAIHLEIDKEIQITGEHPLSTILKQNPALKIRKVTIDAGLFLVDSGETAKLEELETYFQQFGDKDLVTELKITNTSYQTLAFFKIVFTLLDLYKNVKILRLNIDGMEPGLNSHLLTFPSKWNDSRWESLEELHFSYFDWDIHIYTNFMNFCEKLPNLRIITGLYNFNLPFYQKYGKIIKYAYFSYNELTSLMSANIPIQLKGLYILAGNSNHENIENIWNFLNTNQTELEDISLDIDEPFMFEPNGLNPFPVVNYDKVQLLRVHGPVNNDQANQLHQDLHLFKNIKKLYVSLTNFGDCFFGHATLTHLTELKTAEYLTFARENQITCAECFTNLVKSVKHVRKLSLCMPLSSDDIKFIAETIPELEDLKLVKFSTEFDNHYECWPSMEKLEHLLIPFKAALEDEQKVSHLCKACPNLKNIRIFESDNLSEGILGIFVEKLKHLEKMQFDNGTYVVKQEDGRKQLIKM